MGRDPESLIGVEDGARRVVPDRVRERIGLRVSAHVLGGRVLDADRDHREVIGVAGIGITQHRL